MGHGMQKRTLGWFLEKIVFSGVHVLWVITDVQAQFNPFTTKDVYLRPEVHMWFPEDVHIRPQKYHDVDERKNANFRPKFAIEMSKS